MPGRLGLLITLYLITSNVYGSVQAPKSRGFCFIEIWMVGIQSTILLAIFEYALVLLLTRRLKNKKLEMNHVGTVNVREGSLVNVGKQDLDTQKKDHIVQLLDKWTMICSALFFLVFNIGYWSAAKLVKYNVHV